MSRWGEWEISAISGRLPDSPGELAYIETLLFHDMVIIGPRGGWQRGLEPSLHDRPS